MSFEEIKTKIDTSEELQAQILEYITTTEKGKTLLDNYASSFFEKNFKIKVSEIHNQYDKDIEEVLGVKRDANEKTYEFNKKLLLQLKELQEKGSKSSNEEVQKLKEELNKYKLSDAQKEALLTTKINEVKAEYENKLQEVQSQFQAQKIEGVINAAISSLKFNENIPKVALDATKQAKINELIKAAKIDDKGNIIFIDENGQQLRNKLHAIMTVEEIVKTELADLLAKGNNKGGAAAPTVGKNDKGEKILILDESTFSTKTEFTLAVNEALNKLGVALNTAEANKLRMQAAKTYNFSNLK